MLLEKIVRHHRHHDVELEISVRARPGDGGVGADNLRANHHRRLAHHRVDFARHDRAAGLRGGQLNFADAAARPAAEPANVVGDFEKADRDRFKLAARFDDRVLSALRFEMIRRFAKCDSGSLLEMVHHFRGKIVVPIQTGADGGAAEREFLKSDRSLFPRVLARSRDLLRVAAKLLAEPDRRRIHQMGAPDLDDVVKFLRFRA